MQQFIGNFQEYIERLAFTSLFDLNHPTKAMAEQEFTRTVFQLHPNQFEDLMETGSENVVLAFSAVLLKNIPAMEEQLAEVLLRVGDVLIHWYQPDGTLIRRQQGGCLKLYIENTFGQFMGNGLRTLLQKGRKDIVEGLLARSASKPHYRLFLYFRFIESYSNTVEIVNYMEYRTYLAAFQDNFIPRIFEALMPFFLSISEAIDVDELAQLQSSLSLSAEERACVLELSVKSRFTELVFELVEQVTAFRFNISIREYEEFQEFQQVQISFPEELLEKLLKYSFLDVLYGVLLQLMRTTEFKYQLTCLNCLQKVLLAKITYLTRDQQTRFYFTNMRGVLALLRLILNNACPHRHNAIQIVKAANNFIKTFGLDDVDAKAEREGRLMTVLIDWMQVCRALPLFLLQYDPEPLNSENQLFIYSVQLNADISNEIKINRLQSSREIYIEYYRNFTHLFFQSYIGRPTDILGSRSFSFEELKRCASQLLEAPKLLATYHYGETFTLLQNYANLLFRAEIRDTSVANLLLALSEMLRDHRFLQESIFGRGLIGNINPMQEIGGQLSLFSQILARAYTFVLAYLHTQSQPYMYLNYAMVLFVSDLLDRCSRRLKMGQSDNSGQIEDEVYRRLRGWIRVASDEDFLLSCLYVLGKFVQCQNMVNIDFIFQKLHDAIKTIKSNMRREYFKGTAIYAQMWQLFQQLAMQPMPLEFMRWRTILFKTICVLSFDDALDDYRTSIRNTVALLVSAVRNGEWVKLLYDLTGIFESIDSRAIYRYFIRYLDKELHIDLVINQLFHLAFGNPATYLKDFVHLSWYMVENINNRIDPADDLYNVYKILRTVVGYWSMFLQQEKLLSEAEDAVSELYHGMCRVFGSTYINLCVIDNSTSQFRNFLKVLTISMSKCLEYIDSNDELAVSLLDLGLVLTGAVPKALFSIPDLEISQHLNFFVKEIMKRLSNCFNNMASGVMGEKWLQSMLKIVERYYDFLYNYSSRPHLVELTMAVRCATNDIDSKSSFLELAIKIAMDFRTHFASITQLVANICILLVKIFHIEAQTIIGGLGLSDSSDAQELARIFRNANEGVEDYEWLTAQMKDWLKMKTRFIPSSDDY